MADKYESGSGHGKTQCRYECSMASHSVYYEFIVSFFGESMSRCFIRY